MQLVEFIWLDIACIDQRELEPRSAAKVGRQAAIFRGAQAVFIWMTTMYVKEYEHVFGNINWRWTPPAEHTEDTLPNIIDTMVNFLDTLCDPWFSSLWTLQEAYLRPDAYILSQTAELLPYLVYGEMTTPALRDILVYGVNCEGFCSQCVAIDPGNGTWGQLRDRIIEKGLVALRSRNSMALLGAATLRKASVATDRVYGIQQVFGFRLGKSSLLAQPGQAFTLQELENQLGENLLLYEPILSQTHVFLEHVPPNDRWKMNSHSVVPSSLHQLNPSKYTHLERTLCSFWIDHSSSTPKPCRWKGLTIPLKQLSDIFQLTLHNYDFGFGIAGKKREYHLHIFPDMTEEFMRSAWFHDHHPKHSSISQTARTYEFVHWLLQTYSPSSINVLLLHVEL